MIIKSKIIHLKFLYIFFVFLALIIFFFSTTKLKAKAFDINNIDISRPFEINFNKNDVIDEGFRKAFSELISTTIDTTDQKKIKNIKLNEIKGMVKSFSIKEEKFVNEIYYVNLGVSFDKKKVFKYFEKNNIFPSIPLKKKFLFIPIIIDENKKDLLIFNNNNVYDKWNMNYESFYLIDYILPAEDIEDLNSIKNKFDTIEQYNFKDITNKYSLDNSIIALIFRNGEDLRVLSKISIKEEVVLKNQLFKNLNLSNDDELEVLIRELKIIYEDYWKKVNQINTSIKLPLSIKVKNENEKISNFEKQLNDTDLIYDYYISKFDKDYTYYQITFNNTPDIFLKIMSENNYNFNTQNQIWILK